MKAEINIPPEEIQQIIKNYLSSQYMNVVDVKINVGTKLSGNQINEINVPYFKGVTCEVEIPYMQNTNNLRIHHDKI